MDVKYKKQNGLLTLFVYGDLDECSVSNAKNILDKVIVDNLNVESVVFELSGISFMDSTGIGLLIGRYKKLKNYNIKSYISGASVSTEKVLQLAGMYNIMPKI